MLSAFAGPSVVALSSTNTFDKAASTNPLAVSTGLAFTVELQSFNFGFFLGKDFSLVKNTNWYYDKKTWIGLGIGFNLGMFTVGNCKQPMARTAR